MWKKNWLVVKSAGLDCNRTVNRLTKCDTADIEKTQI